MDTEEKDFLDDVEIKPKKKQLSEQKLQHLQNIRVKALEKKKEMKEITEKANKLKEIESLKKAKQYEKEQLAKQYDEMIEKEKKVKEEKPKEEKQVEEKQVEEKPKEKIKDQPHSGGENAMPSGREIKPKKKKIIKKVIYQEASSSDSDNADEVEIVKVKKQPKQIKQPEPQQKPVINNSYSNLLYESSIDKLKSRMMEDRAKYLISSVMPSYG
jgi:hypothetical protein